MGVGARRMVRRAIEGGPVGGARGFQRKGTKPAGASGIPVMGGGLIELVLPDSVGSGEIEGRGLVEVEFGLGRVAFGGRPGRQMRQIELEEDALDGGGEREERDDPHLTAADGTQEREHVATNASRRCPRARSHAHSMRLGRERGVAARGQVGAGFWAWPGGATEWEAGPADGGSSASTGDPSSTGRPIVTTVALRRALGASPP